MAGIKPVRWRTGIESGLNIRHQPLWSWLGANPVANRPRTYFGPIFALVLWLFGLCCLCLMMLWIQSPNRIVVLQFVAGYQTNLGVPHNVGGIRFADRLVGLRDHQANEGLFDIKPSQIVRKKTDLAKAIGQVKTPMLVINFCMHGALDDNGPYLIPDDADWSPEPENRIRFDEILEILHNQPENQIKVVLFDASQMESLWSFGVLDNQFSQGLAQFDQKIREIPNLIVVNSCEPKEYSWMIPHLGMSNFATQFLKCVSGGAKDQNRDGQIDLGEVLVALKSEVATWASINRNSSQTIMILPKDELPGKLLSKAIICQAGRTPIELDLVGPIGAISELRDAWQHFDQFQKSHLSPQQICPELWAVYQKTILRYEALLRAGDVSNALTMRQQLGQLDSRMKNAMQLSLDSSGNSLFFGSITGQDCRLDEDTLKLASELLAGAQGEVASKLKSFVDNTPSVLDRMPPGIRLQWAIMREAAKSSNPNPDRLSFLLDQLDMPGRISCVESHALRLYLRDRPTDPDAYTALPQWINTRLLAELASCGLVNPDSPVQSPERGVAFYFKQIGEADNLRQASQDRLLSSSKEHRVEASRDLIKVRDNYVAIAEKANRSSGDFNRHNSIAAVLPFYTDWVVRLGSPMNPTSDIYAKELGGQIQSAWNHLHAANEELQKAVQALCENEDPEPFLQRFSDFTRAAESNFSPIRTAYRRQCEALSAADVFGREMILDDVLLVPDGDISLRMSLLENTLSKRPKAVGVDPDSYWVKRPPHERSNNTSQAGLLALALIGKTVFDDKSLIPGVDLDSFEQTTDRIKAFMLQPDNGVSFLSQAGAQISLRLGRFQGAVDNLLMLAARSKPEAVLPTLLKAEKLSRIGSYSRTANNENPEAGILLRRCWVNHFLVQQAKRSWTEHLFNVRPIATPYYQFAMSLALGDASKGPVPVGLSETLELSKKNGELEIRRMVIAQNGERKPTTAPEPWTTEKTIQIEFEAGPKKGGAIPWGFVQLEVLPGPDVTFPKEMNLARREINLKPAELAAGGAESQSVWVELISSLVERGQDPAAPTPVGKSQSLLKASGLFRGQRIPLTVPFDLYHTPPLIVSRLAMGGPATMALRASHDALADGGQANGNVGIVIDCSGSMGPTAEGPGKIAEVATALETVIGKLPPGVNLSVWIFGQAVGPGKTVDNPEDYIQLLSGPALLGPDPPALASRLARKLKSGEITPWNQSPLISAMSKAAKSLTGPGSQPGPSTLLVLTDGKDNRASEDKKLNPEKMSIPTLVVKLFAGSGIQVRVIGFQAGVEDPMVKADFEPLGQLNPPGGYSSAADLQELIAQMDRSLRREFRFQMETPINQPVSNQPPGGYEAAIPGFSDRWILPGIPPGEYLLRSGNLRGPLGTVRLQPSDALLLGLSKGHPPRRLGMVDELKARPKAKSAGWSMAIGQNKLENHAVRMMGILEKDWDPSELELAQVKPGMTWWEWSPLEGLSAPTRTWPEPGFHSPVWTLYSPHWPKSPVTGAPVQASLKVWWSPEKSLPFQEEFTQGPDFKVITDLANKTMLLDGENCLLESVKIEERQVLIEPGKVANRKCLVVRMKASHLDLGSVPRGLGLAALDGFPIEGEEQIVHSQVGRVASVFWPVDEKKVNEIKKIQIRSLKKFKDEAKSRGYYLQLDRLGSPDPNDERPRQSLPFVPSTFLHLERQENQRFEKLTRDGTGAIAP